MLTLLEAISLAGDREAQNDDAAGFVGAMAWVIDGATDLHDSPLLGEASDAAWLAQFINADLHAGSLPPHEATLRGRLRAISQHAREVFVARARRMPAEAWKLPLASLLIAVRSKEGVAGLDLGDCRLFALDAEANAHALGGPANAADRESRFAAAIAKSAPANAAALYRTPRALEALRELRAAQNTDPNAAVFTLDLRCGDAARFWTLKLARPAHVLIATDGFAALCDRYAAYDPAAFVDAALTKGLHELGRELRAIEAADAAGEKHPRWKRSDDATALLLRLA